MGGTDTKLIEELIGRGGASGAWAFKALDPCAEQEEGGLQIPDRTATATAPLEGRSDITITAPAATPADGNWDCMILSVPFPEAPIWVFTKDVNAALGSWGTPTIYPLPSIKYGRLSGSATLDFAPLLGQYTDGFRTTYKGFSVIHDSSDLHNEGRVYAGQIRAIPSSEIEDVTELSSGVKSENTRWIMGKIPQDQAALLSACGEMVRGKARDGIYVPVRFNQPKHDFSPCTWAPLPTSTVSQQFFRYLQRIRYELVNSDGTVASASPLFAGTLAQEVLVSGIDNTQLGVAMFMGIHKTSNLDIKVRMGLESQVGPGSPWTDFAKPTPLPDETALTDVAIIADELNVAYPERFNSLGMLIPLIGSAVGSLLNWGVGKLAGWASNRYARRSARQAYVEEGPD